MKTLIEDKTILITGSTDGMGKLLAKRFAYKGANILLHGRNKEKGIQAVKELKLETKNQNITYYNGDFSSLKEVKQLAEDIARSQPKIDILINNAGIGAETFNKSRMLSKDGYELRFAVNYLAQVLLTEKLLLLSANLPSKIINVASVGQESIDFSDLSLEKGYDGFRAYRRSKAALIMYTIDLAGRLKQDEVKVNSLHPATYMNTKMVLDDIGYSLSSIEDGADAVEFVIDSEQSGNYYDRKKLSRAIPQVYDAESRKNLWQMTTEILKDYDIKKRCSSASCLNSRILLL